MARAFPEAMVEGHEGLIPALQLPDEHDRHVLAAAIRAGAQRIVTENLRDFPARILSRYDVEAVSPDQFLASTFELYPSHAMSVLRQMRRNYKHPPMNPGEFLMSLMRVGLAQTAALAEKEIRIS